MSINNEHIDKETFKQIFRDKWEDFKAIYPRYDTPYYNELVEKMLGCGNPEKMGFAQYRCTWCGEIRRVAFSCKSSFCLSCAKPYTDRWVEFIGRRLFPGVVYRHIVLTVPKFLHLWFYRNPELLRQLIRIGHACLRDVFETCAGVKLDIGTIIVLQTAGRSGNYNPHLHILVTGGGLDPQNQWKEVSYIPFEMIHRKWQYHLLNMLRQHVHDPAIEKDIDRGWKNYPKGFVAFVVKGKVPPGGKGLAKYLAKYLVSPPISVRRIESYNHLSVSYWYQDHRTEEVEHETLPVLLFIGRMVQHILPKGFQRISYYGLHSNPRYANVRNLLARILPSNTPPNPLGFRVLPRMPFAELFQKTFGKDPLLCPRCGRHMELESLHHPQYGIINTFWNELFQDVYHAEPFRSEKQPLRGPVDTTQRMVQVPLPFL